MHDRIKAFTTNGVILMCEWTSGMYSIGWTTPEEIENLLWDDVRNAMDDVRNAMEQEGEEEK